MLAKVLPKAKLVPQQDLTELAFRDLNNETYVDGVWYVFDSREPTGPHGRSL